MLKNILIFGKCNQIWCHRNWMRLRIYLTSRDYDQATFAVCRIETEYQAMRKSSNLLFGCVAQPKYTCFPVITKQNDLIRDGVKIICLCLNFLPLTPVPPWQDFKKAYDKQPGEPRASRQTFAKYCCWMEKKLRH